MTQVDFSQYAYFPCLQSTEHEHMAYRHLSDDDKSAIIPILEISQSKNEATFQTSVEMIADTADGRPFILDLSKKGAPPAYLPKGDPDNEKAKKVQASQDAYNASHFTYLNAYDGFSEWRQLMKKFPTAIPTLQFTDPETQGNSILRQAMLLSGAGSECIAVRITPETNPAIFEVVSQVISILQSSSRLLIILDCGQRRTTISQRAEFASDAIARILEGIEPSQMHDVNALCLSDFFTTPSNAALNSWENNSWNLWAEATETFPFLFGDYGANHRFNKQNTFMPGDWKATVVFPLEEQWLIYRHPDAQDADGWIIGAQEISNHPDFDDFPNCWGGELLEKAVGGDTTGGASARFWHAAKINMHIHRQIGYAPDKIGIDAADLGG